MIIFRGNTLKEETWDKIVANLGKDIKKTKSISRKTERDYDNRANRLIVSELRFVCIVNIYTIY